MAIAQEGRKEDALAYFRDRIAALGVSLGSVSSEWIDEATQKQVTGPHKSEARTFDYGFYFWTVPSLEGFAMWGHGGQLVLIVPDEELTLVLTSMPYSGEDIGSELLDAERLAKRLLGR